MDNEYENIFETKHFSHSTSLSALVYKFFWICKQTTMAQKNYWSWWSIVITK